MKLQHLIIYKSVNLMLNIEFFNFQDDLMMPFRPSYSACLLKLGDVMDLT